jgi:GNAT superfamily N-acetyltransferase
MNLRIMIPSMEHFWFEQAPQHASSGKPNTIRYEKHVVKQYGPKAISECLLFYDNAGLLRGIVHHFPNDIMRPAQTSIGTVMEYVERAGNINITVDPAHQRKGIGTKLLREALDRWPINLEKQMYTEEGAALIDAAIR